jgi:hypothetical protein
VELACEGMWWAVRNLARRRAASLAEYQEVFHGKTAAQWAQHYGLPNLSRELEYYVSGGLHSMISHPLCKREVKTSTLASTTGQLDCYEES